MKTLLCSAVFTVFLTASAFADPAPGGAPSGNRAAEKLNVDAIKQKYWAKGTDTQMSVVQNRL